MELENTATVGAEENLEGQTYTEEEFNKKLQSETDRRVTQALEKKQKEWEESFTAKLEEERKKAETLAQMSEKEKQQAKVKDLEERLEQERASKERILLEQHTVNILSEEKLPIDFKDFLIKEDAETTNNNIKVFKEKWEEAVKAEVDNRFVGTTPKVASTNLNTTKKTDIREYAQKNRLI